MRRRSGKNFFASTQWAVLLGGLLYARSTGAQLTTQTLVVSVPAAIDYWQYENASNPLTRTLGPTWVLPPDMEGSSRRHGMDVLIFNLPNLPTIVDILSAKLRLYDIAQARWQPAGESTTDGIASKLELFAAGFGPAYDENAWNGTQPLMAGENVHDPYPRDWLLDVNVDDNITTSTPWVIGAAIGYTPGMMTAPFPVDFTFNLSDPRTLQEFMDDIALKRSSWVFSSTYEIDFIGEPGALPNCIMTEGVGTFPGSQPPTLTLTLVIEVLNGVEDWHLYE